MKQLGLVSERGRIFLPVSLQEPSENETQAAEVSMPGGTTYTLSS